MSLTSLLRLATRRSAAQHYVGPNSTTAKRPLSGSKIQRYARVGSQDKDSIDTEATEYTKSGTDDGAARQENAAFDPSKTSPEEERNVAGEGNEVCLGLDSIIIEESDLLISATEQSIRCLARQPKCVEADRSSARGC
jgi:hypothetical protein